MIGYKYEIIAVDEAARVMEVVYTSPGRQTMHIGVRLPSGEPLQNVIEAYAPVAYWAEQEKKVTSVQVGTSGVVAPDMSLAGVKARKLQQLAGHRFEMECHGIRFHDEYVSTDRNAQSAIAAAQAAVSAGTLTSVGWKTREGRWLTLGATDITALAQAIAAHVQNSFSLERQLAEQVNSATTVEAVEAIVWPE